MFDDFEDLAGMDVSDLTKQPQQQQQSNQYQQNNGYSPPQNNNQQYGNNSGNQNNGGGNQGYQKNNYQGGGGNKFGGGGNKQWNKKEDVVEEPYQPVAIYVDRDYPEDAKRQLFNLIERFIAINVTVRVNGDDREFYDQVARLPQKYIEVYTPWKGFNDIDTKHYFNMETSKHVASVNFSAWDKVPDVVKSMLARNVRMVFGGKNNSIVKCVITWSADGATKTTEVNKDTGRGSFVISLAARYGFPVVNLGKPGAEEVLSRVFGI